MSEEPAADPAAFQALSDGLKDAFARLAATELPDEERGRWQRRLVAITNTAKHDLPRALGQLERFDEDWRRRAG